MHKINLVLLLRDAKLSRDLGRALWAAFREVEVFFNHGEDRAQFKRFYLAQSVPDNLARGAEGGLSLEAVWRFIERLSGGRQEPKQIAHGGTIIRQAMDSEWKSAEGQYTRTYDARKIFDSVRRVLGDDGHVGIPVTVTDQELTPPPNWRYILWSHSVISMAPTDPRYWHMSEAHRVGIVKHRVRTACLSVVGALLGLERCDNPSCFLYRHVDSVMNLDEMIHLGREHDLEQLKGRGFDMLTDNPGAVQEITAHPRRYEEIWYE
jgi:hypothetical protein